MVHLVVSEELREQWAYRTLQSGLSFIAFPLPLTPMVGTFPPGMSLHTEW